MPKSLKRGTTTVTAAFALIAAMGVSGTALAQADRATGLQLTGDKPVEIEGDQLEVMEDKSMAVFSGNVRIVQGETIMRTGKLTIHYLGSATNASITSGASQIDRLEATGGVNIQSGTQVATGDTGIFNMKSEVLVLSGKRVTLSEDGNVATGCKLTVAMQTGRAKLEGCGDTGSRPTILLQPRSDRGGN
ncbi:MAG: LptA/OstA family protein [Oricola sp.]